ncbi:MAG: hypothetical protein M3X11_04760 [Acidobacteriota bacterium]|nr:hypothetical protein [Acidobacteriota bacterium]
MEQKYLLRPVLIRQIKSKPVTIRVIEGRLVTEPANQTISLEAKEEIEWKSEAGELEIRFAPGASPFRGESFRTGKGGSCLSGLPSKDKVGKVFRYTVLVTNQANGVLVTQAPALAVTNKSNDPFPPTGNPQGKGCLSLLGFG